MCYRLPAGRQQLTIISSYTIDARITKPICMIPLCIQILVILPKNAISLWIFQEFKCMGGGGVICNIYQTGFIMWLSDHPQKWK